MKNSDGGICRLNWRLNAGVYTGTVVGHPHITVSAPTFAEMKSLLIEAVDARLHAGEWTADWDPPAPTLEHSRGRTLDSHCALAWEGTFVGLQDPAELFASYCDACGRPRGQRSDTPLRVAIEQPGNLCGDFGTLPGAFTIFSRELADQIVNLVGSDDRIAFRPVERLGRGRKEYVEPVAAHGATLPQTISIKEDQPAGICCDTCDAAYRYMDIYKHGVQSFHRAADLPIARQGFWIADLSGFPQVCVSVDWWSTNRGSKAARGVVSKSIGIADDALIDPVPTLNRLENQLSLRRLREQWLKKQSRRAESLGVAFSPWTP